MKSQVRLACEQVDRSLSRTSAGFRVLRRRSRGLGTSADASVLRLPRVLSSSPVAGSKPEQRVRQSKTGTGLSRICSRVAGRRRSWSFARRLSTGPSSGAGSIRALSATSRRGASLCGENGEDDTVVTDGPLFATRPQLAHGGEQATAECLTLQLALAWPAATGLCGVDAGSSS